jgi:ribose transport system substrate-binding protein
VSSETICYISNLDEFIRCSNFVSWSETDRILVETFCSVQGVTLTMPKRSDPNKISEKPRYFIEAVAKTLDVLESFSDNAEQLSIMEIARRTKLPYTSAFRFLYTLEKRGYIARVPGKRKYALAPARKRFRIGYAGLGKIAFGAEVTRSVLASARQMGISLLHADNEDDPSKALANSEQLLSEGIHVLIEFQRHEAISHLIAAKCHSANVPAIAINFPQPGAYYFGPDSHKTGWLAGDFLQRTAVKLWPKTRVSCLVIPTKGLGLTQNTRLVGLRESLRTPAIGWSRPQVEISESGVTKQDGFRLARPFLRKIKKDRLPALVAAFSDPLAIGAERAIKEAGLQKTAIVIGQGGTAEARKCIARGGPFKASVAYFPEHYGERVLKLAIKIAEGERPPLVTYIDHVVLTKDNMTEFYSA